MNIEYKKFDALIFEKSLGDYYEWVQKEKELFLRDDAFSLAAMDGDMLAGFICVTPRGLEYPLEHLNDAYIEIYDVHEDYRRQGIGRYLVNCAEDWARTNGFRQIRTHHNDRAVAAINMSYALGYSMCPWDYWINGEKYSGYWAAKLLNPDAVSFNKEYLKGHWYADIYEQKITETDEAECVISIAKDYDIKNILEIACGGGRNTIPLSKAGYNITGFDFDEHMLEKLKKRIKSEKLDISYSKANAITHDWGKDFDLVVMAGNIFVNIITESDYAETQELFIKKAADCVKPGGYLYLDFYCSHSYNQEEIKEEKTEESEAWVCFEGTDDIGTYGKYIVDGDMRRYEITPKGGEMFKSEFLNAKHFPTFAEVKSWLTKAGWEIEQLYGSRDKKDFDEKADDNYAVIWAKKK